MTQDKDIFQAIADPTRRQIIKMLASQPLNMNTIAEQFDITRQAVSLHVQFLNECGLITVEKKGRERFCEARLDKLSEVSDWVEESKKIWLQRFQSLENFLDKTYKNKKSTTKNAKRK